MAPGDSSGDGAVVSTTRVDSRTRAKESVGEDTSWMTSGAGHPRRWSILAVLVTVLLVVVLDTTVLNIALPTIQRDLQASQSQLLWAVDSYVLVFAALLYTWGVLGDRWGRKRVLIIGLAIFGTFSVVSAFSTTPLMLILARAGMGVGGAAVMPVTLAIITVVFPPHERGRAIGTWAGAVGAAVALGPVLGGLLLQHPEWSSWLTGNDWGSVFLINVPIVIIGLVGITMVVPESRNPFAPKLDIIGLVLSFTGLVALVYGIIHASSVKTWTAPGVVIPIAAGIVVIGAFLWYEARSSHRSFDVGLFRNRTYAVSLTTASLTFFALNGIAFALPFYLQTLRGLDTLQAGLAFVPFALGQLVTAPQSAGLAARFGYRSVMATGLALVLTALVVLSTIRIDTDMWVVLAVFLVFGCGMGLTIAPATTLMQNALPLSRAGAGSAVQNTVRQVFGALGVAIMGTVLGTQYSNSMSGGFSALADDFPTDRAQQSVVATDQILDAAEASGAPSDLIDAVREAAFQSFLDAAHLTFLLGAGVLAIVLVVVLAVLPRTTAPSPADPLRPRGHDDGSGAGSDDNSIPPAPDAVVDPIARGGDERAVREGAPVAGDTPGSGDAPDTRATHNSPAVSHTPASDTAADALVADSEHETPPPMDTGEEPRSPA